MPPDGPERYNHGRMPTYELGPLLAAAIITLVVARSAFWLKPMAHRSDTEPKRRG